MLRRSGISYRSRCRSCRSLLSPCFADEGFDGGKLGYGVAVDNLDIAGFEGCNGQTVFVMQRVADTIQQEVRPLQSFEQLPGVIADGDVLVADTFEMVTIEPKVMSDGPPGLIADFDDAFADGTVPVRIVGRIKFGGIPVYARGFDDFGVVLRFKFDTSVVRNILGV